MTIGEPNLIRLGKALAATSVLLGMFALVMALIADPRLLIDDFDVNLLGVMGVGLGALTWVTISRQPRNGAVWALAVSGFFASINVVSEVGGTLLIRRSVPGFNFQAPGDLTMSDLSTAAAWATYPAAWAWPLAFFIALNLGLMLFPDGRAPSHRWRWLGWYNAIVIVLLTAANAWLFRPGSVLLVATPVEELPGAAGTVAHYGLYFLMAGSLMSVIALIVRYRRSAGVERRQIRWIAWGGASVIVSLAGAMAAAALIVGNIEAPDIVVDEVIFLVGEILLILSFAIAITKFRLYDIDIIVSKTVAYLTLAVVIAALYVVAVLGLIALFGDPNQRGGELGLEFWFGATALVAIVFEPLRVRLQRLANRAVYGKRAAPHEVLSRLTARLSETSANQGLLGLAQLLREGTGADSSQVWLRVGDRLRVEAASPFEAMSSFPDVDAERDLPASDLELSVPVHHGGELLGALGITKPRSHPITEADEELLLDVAAGAGLLLRNLRLNAELTTRADQLQASRRRLIVAQDSARHRLERDLHDGAQQQVVALKVRLGIARTVAEREGAHDVAVRVADLAEGTQEAVDAMRIVARGIYPPLLEAEGLGPALAAAQRAVDLPLDIEMGTLPRYSKEVEECAYFCLLAAATRAKMAGATFVQMKVQGDGVLFAATAAYDSADRGDLTALTDRAEAFGGMVTTTTAAGGTTLTLTLPVDVEVLEPA